MDLGLVELLYQSIESWAELGAIQLGRVLFGDEAQEVLHHEVNVERDQDAPPQRVGVEQRGDVELLGFPD